MTFQERQKRKYNLETLTFQERQKREYNLEKFKPIIIPESFWDNWEQFKKDVLRDVPHLVKEEIKVEQFEVVPLLGTRTKDPEDTDFSVRYNHCVRCGAITVNRLCDNCIPPGLL